MKKSHYYVQKYDNEDGYRTCAYCGNKFKTNRKDKKYCSQECYKKSVKIVKAMWYQKNREHCDNLHQEWLKRSGFKQVRKRAEPKPPTVSTSSRLIKRIKYKRDIIIKRELLKMELLSLQLLDHQRIKWCKKNFKCGPAAKINYKRLDYIKGKLKELDLPNGEVYEIEIPDEYKDDIRETVTKLKQKWNL